MVTTTDVITKKTGLSRSKCVTKKALITFAETDPLFSARTVDEINLFRQ